MVSEWSLNPNDNWNDDPGNGFDDSGFGNHCYSDGDFRFWYVDGLQRIGYGLTGNADGVTHIAYGVPAKADGVLSNIDDG